MPAPRQPDPTPLGLNLAPMVDVVMCLIIFFMLATKMVERENSRIDLPEASKARQADKRALGRRVVVNIQAGVGGAAAAGVDGATYLIEDRAVSLAEVRRRLEAEVRQDAQVRCVIRGDRELQYHAVEAVLTSCARAGIAHVVFAANRESSEP